MAAKPIINRSWIPLNALRAFEAVGRHLSFTAGGQALNVSQSALSRHVQTLESLLGSPLLIRRPHGLELTASGQALLPAISRSFDAIEREMNEIIRNRGRASHQRTLRVHMPPSFLQQIAIPALKYFHREYPDILIDVFSSNGTGMPKEEPDVAVVYDRPQVSQTVTDLLWMINLAPVCAPEIAEAHQGKSLEQFLRDNELLHVKLEGQARGIKWASYVQQLKLDVNTDRGLAFDTASYAASYAIAGTGVALTDLNLFAPELAAGRLVMPYDAIIDEGYGYFLILRPEDLADPVVALFRSWMIEHCARPPAP
ncbi:MAG: LysR family transcriptional regulator [Acidiphilium sp. 37-64-53]|uniref:LysR substrate-binding domain-containing protein n=1 Tax=Acidiphilium TaxID=522 RepID=UPI000BC859ED|nr:MULTISPECIES: LysR substrate-binding domain-containing protein [Acidiphilium]OYW00549.1 MAG: LysR family transcriptional regulator [Acidiphilium sp. 37-64-53]OZB23712.1 MAG: LysR family transcriptional regulator [Acidiphilium sp. 34-64-41]HQT86018.1 LysR substrate-binding domain-containing protein [Acidiphilium rubrum]